MRIVLTPREYEEFVEILEGPPRRCPKLVRLLSEPAPWEIQDDQLQDSVSSNPV